MGRLLFAVIFCSSLFTIGFGSNETNIRQYEQKLLDNMLKVGTYDSRVRPSTNTSSDKPILVTVSMHVLTINKLDDLKMEYSAQVYFRQQWQDDRLKFDDISGRIKYLALAETSMLWMPDLFFVNERKGYFHSVVAPNVFSRIYPNGSVLVSARLSLTLACPMDLRTYPFDVQTCSMRIESYGFNAKDIVLAWKDNGVTISDALNIQPFVLTSIKTQSLETSVSNVDYSCIKLDMTLKRQINHYLIQVFIPSTMLIIMAWLSFWMDGHCAIARSLICLSTLSLMVMRASDINATTAPVSYTRALDIWTGVCMTFIFASLVQLVVVNFISRTNPNQNRKEGDTDANAKAIPIKIHQMKAFADPKLNDRFVMWLEQYPNRSECVDAVARVLYPALFVVFNIAYWTTYL